MMGVRSCFFSIFLKKLQNICRSAHVRQKRNAYNNGEQVWVGVIIPFLPVSKTMVNTERR